MNFPVLHGSQVEIYSLGDSETGEYVTIASQIVQDPRYLPRIYNSPLAPDRCLFRFLNPPYDRELTTSQGSHD